MYIKSRITTSLIIIALASALAGGAASAIFIHSAEIEEHLISPGCLEFVLVGEPFDLAGMERGDVRAGYVEIANTGTLDMIFRAYFLPESSNTAGFSDDLQIRVVLNPDGYISDIYAGFSSYGDANTLIFEGAFNNLLFPGLDNESAAFERPPRPLKAGNVAVYRLETALPLDTESQWENVSFKGALIVEGTPAGYQTPGNVKYY